MIARSLAPTQAQAAYLSATSAVCAVPLASSLLRNAARINAPIAAVAVILSALFERGTFDHSLRRADGDDRTV